MTNNTSSDEARAALLRDIIRHGGYLPEDQILALGHSSETLQAAFDRGDLADFFGCPGLSNDNIGA